MNSAKIVTRKLPILEINMEHWRPSVKGPISARCRALKCTIITVRTVQWTVGARGKVVRGSGLQGHPLEQLIPIVFMHTISLYTLLEWIY